MMYDRSYFSDGGGWVCGFWRGSYESNERHLRDEAIEALKAIPVKSGRLLEIGCAGGFFLDEARKAGFDVSGVELNREMVEHARRELSLTVHQGMFEKVGLEPNGFEVIVVQDVLEHVRDPRAFVASVTRVLAPGGYFFVRGPLEDTTKGWVYRTVRKLGRRGQLLVQEPPFHLQGFCRRSFTAVIRANGLTPEEFEAAAMPPRRDFAGIKNTVATVIEHVGYYVDRVRGGGDFMIAVARKGAPEMPL
jgi:SAM-dependent methyltransferase